MHPNPIVCTAEAGELESCRLRFEELDTLTAEYIFDNVIYDDFNKKNGFHNYNTRNENNNIVVLKRRLAFYA